MESEEDLPKDELNINEEDIVDFDNKNYSLPYLKSIEVTKCTPQQFGLDRWLTPFRIPDSFMKRLYLKEAYIDTDLDYTDKSEKLTCKQRKVLGEWLRKNRLKDSNLVPKNSRRRPPLDNLFDDLNHPYELLDYPLPHVRDVCKASVDDTPREARQVGPPDENIALCYKHKIQPEEMIAKIAIDSMKRLPPSQERRFQELLKDRAYMDYLNKQVENYHKKDRAERESSQESD